LLHTPGHTPGSQCFLVEEEGHPGRLVSGDTLFLGSCGRVDLPGSDPEAMYRSLNETLKQLPDETLLFPGHLYSAEASDTLGNEKRNNPFLLVAILEQFLMFMGSYPLEFSRVRRLPLRARRRQDALRRKTPSSSFRPLSPPRRRPASGLPLFHHPPLGMEAYPP
jgi:glyoxylase-like metal-dependent hydrolase (beta-lactamase superfamily II)